MDRFIGKRLDGRYEIKEIVGMGGMAVVYKAYDNIADRIVAVKILKEEYSGNEEFLRRFKNESKAVALLSHPNIVKIFDVSFGDLIQYIVMEYIDGITLKEYIEQQGALSWKDTVHFTVQILRGLQHAHDKGVVHRDVKPQNIMLLPDRTIKVTDFGIARFARNEHQTMTDKAIGSVHYISPEQAKGEFTDEKADIYSVGVMMYEMLTGQVPFSSKSAVSVAIMQLQNEPKRPTEINPDIPLGLEDIVMHAMQKSPAQRYKTAAEMLHDLEEFKRSPDMRFDYSYFVDDSPTKFVAGEGIVTDGDEDGEEKEEEQRAPVIPILAGIAATLIVALVVLGIVVFPKLFGDTGGSIKVPQFIGMSFDEINSSEYMDTFKFDYKWEYNADQPYGVVFSQDPAYGQSLKRGNSTVTIWISQGTMTINVPNVYGYVSAAAAAELERVGLKYKLVTASDEEVAAWHVIKTEPERGAEVQTGEEIIIYESSGPATVFLPVPDLLGMTETAAKKTIESKKFTIGNVYPVDSVQYKAGLVVEQTPRSGEQAGQGSVIDIGVSTGHLSYTYDLTVTLPKDFESATYIVSAWVDGVKQKSAEVDSTVKDTQVFNITAQDTEFVNVKVYIQKNSSSDPYLYVAYAVDMTGETKPQLISYYDYPKAVPVESNPSSDVSDTSDSGNSSNSESDNSSDSGGTDSGDTASSN